MMIPPKLTHGDNLANLFEKFNLVIDYLREIRLVAGNGIRINRMAAGTTIESTATETGGTSASNNGSSDKWYCEIKEEGNSILLHVNAKRKSDSYHTVIFRGKYYNADDETFSLSAEDLESTVYVYLVKSPYSTVFRFLIALSHRYYSNEASGCVMIARVYRQNGTIQIYMEHDRLFEWKDPYQVPGNFAADLVFTGIIHNDDEPAVIPFYDFIETAEQKLAIARNYPLLVNGMYVIGTTTYEYDSYIAGFDTFSIYPTGHEYDALLVFWCAELQYAPAVTPYNIRYSIEPKNSFPYSRRGGAVRIPVLNLSSADSTTNLRFIESRYSAKNFPEISINRFADDYDADKSAWVYVDHENQLVKMRLLARFDGVLSNGWHSLEVGFSTFQNAGSGKPLSICAYYNTSSHQWSNTWFELDGNAITTKPASVQYDQYYYVRIADIAYNSENGFPYVASQNFMREVIFSSASVRFSQYDTKLMEIMGKLDNHENRIQALEQAN